MRAKLATSLKQENTQESVREECANIKRSVRHLEAEINHIRQLAQSQVKTTEELIDRASGRSHSSLKFLGK